MQTGLLWFDNDPQRELMAKIEDAARRYLEKFGMPPNTCYVNQGVFNEGMRTIAWQSAQGKALHVVPARNILPHHFWVGVEEAGV